MKKLQMELTTRLTIPQNPGCGVGVDGVVTACLTSTVTVAVAVAPLGSVTVYVNESVP